MKAVMRVQTFQIIVLQGIVGSLPWTAMVFFTMWFELIGKDIFTPTHARTQKERKKKGRDFLSSGTTILPYCNFASLLAKRQFAQLLIYYSTIEDF